MTVSPRCAVHRARRRMGLRERSAAVWDPGPARPPWGRAGRLSCRASVNKHRRLREAQRQPLGSATERESRHAPHPHERPAPRSNHTSVEAAGATGPSRGAARSAQLTASPSPAGPAAPDNTFSVKSGGSEELTMCKE